MRLYNLDIKKTKKQNDMIDTLNLNDMIDTLNLKVHGHIMVPRKKIPENDYHYLKQL